MGLEVIRQMDKLGRICIPKDFRKSFDITKDTRLLLVMTDEGILLKKRGKGCTVQKRGCLIKNSSKSMQKYEKHGQNYILANS